MPTDDKLLRQRLRGVYWLGGGSGAGKSTIARKLADRHELCVYSTDEAMRDHDHRIDLAEAPLLAAFKKMDMDERWVNRSPKVMLETFHWFAGEGFELIVEDLLAMPPDLRVIVEGFRLLPHLVAPLLERKCQALWLIPTPQFRLAAFKSRGSLMTIAEKTSNPSRALVNFLQRDEMFTNRIERETREQELCAIRVDGSMSEEELTRQVAMKLALE